MSLKFAAESLTGGACYHMIEVFKQDNDAAKWSRVLEGEISLLDEVLESYDCAIDWPMSSMWAEAAERYPDAVVLLSHRSDAETWWKSADRTVWQVMRSIGPDDSQDWRRLNELLCARFADPWDDPVSAMAAYEAHNETVRATISPERLVEYQPGDGWGPLCKALGVDEPDRPFPHVNTSEEFIERIDKSK